MIKNSKPKKKDKKEIFFKKKKKERKKKPKGYGKNSPSDRNYNDPLNPPIKNTKSFLKI